MPSRKGVRYLAPLLSLGLVQKAATCSVVLPVAAESVIASVDIYAGLSGYDRLYKENVDRITKTLEDELHLKIRPPQVETSFFACRSIMLKSVWRHYEDFGLDPGFRDYFEDYVEFTGISLLMNGYISEDIFGQKDQTLAIYEQGVVCLAPFDKQNPLGIDMTVGHEIMHSYVHQINPNFDSVNNPEELPIRRLVGEGIATYASDLVFGNGLIILTARLMNLNQYNLEDLKSREFLYYGLGTNFVACAVDEVGSSAFELLSKYPPSTYEEIKDCKGYIRSLMPVE